MIKYKKGGYKLISPKVSVKINKKQELNNILLKKNFKQNYKKITLPKGESFYRNVKPTNYTNFEISPYNALYNNNGLMFVKPTEKDVILYYIDNEIKTLEGMVLLTDYYIMTIKTTKKEFVIYKDKINEIPFEINNYCYFIYNNKEIMINKVIIDILEENDTILEINFNKKNKLYGYITKEIRNIDNLL